MNKNNEDEKTILSINKHKQKRPGIQPGLAFLEQT